ncbi:hypothetical protein L1887_43420 [Cichorium endivia]|nr:hypothetical protein L1887_43420 [Cichorium endivia]
MATGTAGRSLDGLVKGAAISTESFWSADLPLWRSGEAQHSEAGPSRSSSIHSRRGTCTPTTLTPPSPTANKLLSPPFDVVSTRLAPSNEPTPPTTYRSAQHLDGQSAADLECTGAPLLSGFQMAGLSASPEQVATSSSARSHPSHASTIPSAFSLNRSTAIPALWSTPSSLQSDPVAAPHPSRPAGPTLARLNTSEMLRTQNASSAASGAVPSTPAIVSKSPSSLKLQLDTSVPRRSATLSSYPHAAKPRFAIPTMEVPRPHHSVKSHGLDALLSSTRKEFIASSTWRVRSTKVGLCNSGSDSGATSSSPCWTASRRKEYKTTSSKPVTSSTTPACARSRFDAVKQTAAGTHTSPPVTAVLTPASLGQVEFVGGSSSIDVGSDNATKILCLQEPSSTGHSCLFEDDVDGRLSACAFRLAAGPPGSSVIRFGSIPHVFAKRKSAVRSCVQRLQPRSQSCSTFHPSHRNLIGSSDIFLPRCPSSQSQQQIRGAHPTRLELGLLRG